MRRKTFDVLFEPGAGMTELVRESCLWRSAWYYTMSVGFFSGVVINSWFLQQPLSVRMALILAGILICATVLLLYGFIIHGIVETYGQAGDPVGILCLLGYTTLPFLLLTPAALLAGKWGLAGLPLLAAVFLAGCCWMLYLLVRSIQVVYIIDFKRAAGVVLLSLLLLYIAFFLPLQIGWLLLARWLA